jgi:hypothetical protein
MGNYEIWCNMSTIDIADGRVVNWYGFIRNEQILMDDFVAAVKLSYSYYRQRTGSNNATINIELRAFL